MQIRITNPTDDSLDERLWYHDKEGEVFPSILRSDRGYLVAIDGKALMILLEHAEVLDDDTPV